MKSYTDIEQSKKLAEILPPETADMRIGNYVGKSGKVDGTNVHYYLKGESFGAPEIINAWSLAALIGLMPLEIKICKQTDDIFIYYYIEFENRITYLSSKRHKELVDACVEMILKLNELKML